MIVVHLMVLPHDENQVHKQTIDYLIQFIMSEMG